MTPATLLGLLELLHRPAPVGHLVSIRGYNFDFHRKLSAETSAIVGQAVDYILRLVNQSPLGTIS
jgi:hypothetical protein